MGMRDDLETMEYYSKRGLLKEYLEGTLTPEQREQAANYRERAPIDPTATMSMNSRRWEEARGD